MELLLWRPYAHQLTFYSLSLYT